MASNFRSFARCLALVCLAAAAPAHANWVRADSPHFVVFANDSEGEVARFAQNLERFHAAMALLTGGGQTVPSPSNRVTIFAVGGARKIEKLAGSERIAGFYIPRASGSRAFVPEIRNTSGENDFSMTVLLHEYAHHFLISSSRFEMPRWFSEGAAEFFASAKFEKDGSVGIGRPAYHRTYDIKIGQQVTALELLDSKVHRDRRLRADDSFYGRAWLLYHMLAFEPGRKGQLQGYARAIASGKSEREAAESTFGDLEQLNKELVAYLKRPRIAAYTFTPDKVPAAPVRVVTLSDGESAVMPHKILSQRGVDKDTAAKVVGDIREVAVKYPQDAGVLTALAEAEFDAGNDAAAIAAADKALALDQTRTNAYIQKGYALFRMAGQVSGDAKAEAFKTAMVPFEKLNAIENDNPMPLIYFYRSFIDQKKEPTDLARHALERASQLAPYDRGLALNTALMQAREGKIALATAGLRALAANPHGGGLATAAAKLAEDIGALSEGTAWSGQDVDENLDSAEDAGAD